MDRKTEFVFGLQPEKKSAYLLEGLRQSLAAGRRVLLIVPEQQALDWDRRCAAALSPREMLRTEIVSFTRLADSVFRRVGGVAAHYITDAKKTLVMWHTLASLSEHLTVYKRGVREDRYVPMLLSTVSELKAYSVTPAMLEEAAQRLEEAGKQDTGHRGGETALATRLRDLSLIYAAYDAILHESYDDPEEIPDALIRALEQHDCFSDYDVYIDSFYTLTPKEKEITEHLLRQAQDVTVTFACPLLEAPGEEMYLSHIREYVKDMVRRCSRAGRAVETTEIDCTAEGPIGLLLRSLWDHTAVPDPTPTEEVQIVHCGDVYDEAYAAGAVIERLIRSGARYGDIAVVAADIETRRSITDRILSDLGIPVYLSGKKTALMQPAVRLLLAAAAVIAGGWQQEDVIACAKTGLCGVAPEDADVMEQYTERWRIRGKRRYCDPDGWSMNPDGYQDKITEQGIRILARANAARGQLIPPLEAFSEAFPGTPRDICAAAFKLLCDFHVYEQLHYEALRLEQNGDGAQEVRQVWGVLCDILDTIAIGGQTGEMDAPRFAGLLRRTAEACRIGTIPDGIDRVVLGSADRIRLSGIRHVILLGAVYGEFPAVPADRGFFTTADKDILSGLGIGLSPDRLTRQGEALFHFYRAATAPTDTLTVMIPLKDGAPHPSTGAARILHLLPNAKTMDLTRPDALELVWSPEAGRRLLQVLCDTQTGAVLESLLPGAAAPGGELCADRAHLSAATAAALCHGEFYTSQSRIEKFLKCPFSYYGNYILRLNAAPPVELQTNDVGNFVHKILEEFLRESASAPFPMEDALLRSRAKRLIDKYMATMAENAGANRRTEYLFHRVARSVLLYATALNEEFGQSEFVPYDFELPIGREDTLPAMRIPLDENTVMLLPGIVDRLDILRRDGAVYVRVVDYKTGTKNFSLADISEGRSVQLLLYLFSLCAAGDSPYGKRLAPAGERIIPAGAIYFSARPGEATSKTALNADEAQAYAVTQIGRSGVLLDDESVLSAMEKFPAPGEKYKYLPLTLTPTHKLHASSKNRLKTEAEFDGIRSDLTEALRDVGSEIKNGDAASRPERGGRYSPCVYCSLKPLCRHQG